MWILKWLPTFCPMLNISQNKERYTNSLLTYHHLSELLDESGNFLIFSCRGSRWRPWPRRWAFVCVCLSLSRQGQPRVPPFSKSKISLQKNIARLYGLVSFSIYDRGILKRSGSQYLMSPSFRDSRWSLFISKDLAAQCPASLNEFLFERDSHETRSNESVTWVIVCWTLDIVRIPKLNRLHLIIVSTKSFRVRERRLIIFRQNMLGEESSFGTVESRVDDLRHFRYFRWFVEIS
jgi:hypothetical protein